MISASHQGNHLKDVETEPRWADPPATVSLGTRAALARERAQRAWASLGECRLCALNCGVNRLAGEVGPCHATMAPRIFSSQVELSDELEFIPTYAIAFSGCDMRCVFCITGLPSWNAQAGEVFQAPQVAARARSALANGARSVMILGGEPTLHLPAVLEFVAEMPDSAKLIWKTNGHGAIQARELLTGLFDVWSLDYKFGNDACAQALSGTLRYTEIVRENLHWARDNSELVVRHLLMPGHVDCCWQPVAEWLAQEAPGVKVNLRSGYWPAWRATRHTTMGRCISEPEVEKGFRIAQNLGLNLIE